MIDILKPLIKKFMPFAQTQMGFSRPPKLFLQNDTKNSEDPLGKTGFYDPQAESITLYVTGRHPKDILRSLAHELMHHTQKCNGDFDNVSSVGEQGYAQSDPHMRNMEIQAYQASIVFRDWEDSLKETIYYEHLQKGDNKMSFKDWKNNELNVLLLERFGIKAKPLAEMGADGDCVEDEKEMEEGNRTNVAGREQGRTSLDPKTHERLREEEEEDKEREGAVYKYMKEEEEEEVEEGRQPRMQRQRQDLNSPTQDLRTTAPSPEAHTQPEEEEEEEERAVAEGGAANRQGNEEKDVGRNRMHADRVHEVEGAQGEEEFDEATDIVSEMEEYIRKYQLREAIKKIILEKTKGGDIS